MTEDTAGDTIPESAWPVELMRVPPVDPIGELREMLPQILQNFGQLHELQTLVLQLSPLIKSDHELLHGLQARMLRLEQQYHDLVARLAEKADRHELERKIGGE